MKRLTLYFITIFTLCSFTTAFSITEKESPKTESTEAQVLINRLEEIKAIDKSNMKSPEKRQLRKEVRSIKKSLTEMNGGVYLSVGAIIIIILLLILLL